MARTRRGSPVLDAARQRLAGIKSITPPPDFGSGLTLAAYETEVNTFEASLDSYNQKLAQLDDAQNSLDLADCERNMLADSGEGYKKEQDSRDAINSSKSSSSAQIVKE